MYRLRVNISHKIDSVWSQLARQYPEAFRRLALNEIFRIDDDPLSHFPRLLRRLDVMHRDLGCFNVEADYLSSSREKG